MANRHDPAEKPTVVSDEQVPPASGDPEDRPAHPEIKPNTMQPILWIGPIVLLIIAVVVGIITFQPLLAIIIAIPAVLLLVYTPVSHAWKLRRESRDELDRGDPRGKIIESGASGGSDAGR